MIVDNSSSPSKRVSRSDGSIRQRSPLYHETPVKESTNNFHAKSTSQKSILDMSSITRHSYRRRTTHNSGRENRYNAISPYERRRAPSKRSENLKLSKEVDEILNRSSGSKNARRASEIRRHLDSDLGSGSEMGDASSPLRNRKARVAASVGMGGLNRIPSLKQDDHKEQQQQMHQREEGIHEEDHSPSSEKASPVESRATTARKGLQSGEKVADDQWGVGEDQIDEESSDFENPDDDLYSKEPTQTLNHTELTKIIRGSRNETQHGSEERAGDGGETEGDIHDSGPGRGSLEASGSPDRADGGHLTEGDHDLAIHERDENFEDDNGNGNGNDNVHDDGDGNGDRDQTSDHLLDSPDSRPVFSGRYLKGIETRHIERYRELEKQLEETKSKVQEQMELTQELFSANQRLETLARESQDREHAMKASLEMVRVQLADSEKRVAKSMRNESIAENTILKLRREIHETKTNAHETEQNVRLLKESNAELETRIRESDQSLSTLRKMYNDQTAIVHQLKEEKNQISQNAEKLEAKLTSVEKSQASKDGQIADLENELEKIRDAAADAEQRAEEAELKIANLELAKKNLLATVSEHEDLIKSYDVEFERAKRDFEHNIAEMQAKSEQRTGELDMELSNATQQSSKLKETITSLQLAVVKADEKVADYEVLLQKYEDSKSKFEMTQAQVEKVNHELSRVRDEQQQQMASRDQKIAELEQSIQNSQLESAKLSAEAESLRLLLAEKDSENSKTAAKERARVEADVAELQTRCAQFERTIKDKDEQIAQLESSTAKQMDQLDEYLVLHRQQSSKLEDSQAELAKKSEQNKIYESKIGDLLDAIDKLRLENDELNSQHKLQQEENQTLGLELRQAQESFESQIERIYDSVYKEYAEKHTRKMHELKAYYEGQLNARAGEMKKTTRDLDFAKAQVEKLRADYVKLLSEKCASPQKGEPTLDGSRI
ncbi:uncharacterized protein LODBEIA_P50280 [Lodderomyces beijingensis]|uniref:Uncharacterized protein n=1 Tax=Lodderomyces beijingensis TaxID=1775926 RepID=A0ABP0ZSB4_9ASCO